MIRSCCNGMQKILLVSVVLFSVWLPVSVLAQSDTAVAPNSRANSETKSAINEEVEALKKAALNLNRDLILLEEELLFPGNTQVAVFVSMNIGEFFQLDAVKVKLDDRIVGSHLYTERQVDALFRGGMQRIYVGNVRSGQHEISAFFTGKGPEGRDYKRAAKLNFIKTSDPAMLE
jgi:hypothetical protein